MKVIAIRDSPRNWYKKGDIFNVTDDGLYIRIAAPHQHEGQPVNRPNIVQIKNNKIRINSYTVCVHLWKKQNCQ